MGLRLHPRYRLVIVGVIILMLGLWLALRTPHQAAVSPTPSPDATATAPLVDIRLITPQLHAPQIIFPGVTHADQEVEIKSQSRGRIIQVATHNQSRTVDAGAIVATLAPESLPSQIQAHTTKIVYLKHQIKVDEALQSKGFSSRTKSLKLLSELADEEALLQHQMAELDRKKIRAPFRGILEKTYVEIGSIVDAGALVARMLNLDYLRVQFAVPETMTSPDYRPTKVQVLVGDSPYPAVITRQSQGADAKTHAFEKEVRMNNSLAQLPQGMSVRVALMLQPILAYSIPHQALTLDEQGSLGVKIVDATSKVAFIPVRIVEESHKNAWVVPTIPFKDAWRLIISGQESVLPGAQVRTGQ